MLASIALRKPRKRTSCVCWINTFKKKQKRWIKLSLDWKCSCFKMRWKKTFKNRSEMGYKEKSVGLKMVLVDHEKYINCRNEIMQTVFDRKKNWQKIFRCFLKFCKVESSLKREVFVQTFSSFFSNTGEILSIILFPRTFKWRRMELLCFV